MAVTMKVELKPVRELDALIAEKVFGAPAPRDANAFTEAGYWTADDKQIFFHCRRYSTDIAAAWEVVEKLNLLECNSLGKNINGEWGVWDNADSQLPVLASTAPHAICLAALRVAGEDVR